MQGERKQRETESVQSGKRNERARVLTVHQAPSFKKIAGFWSIVYAKQFTNFVCFLNIPGKQQHFNLMGNQFFSDKINLMIVFESFHMKLLLNKKYLIFPVTTPTVDLGQNIRKNCSFSVRLLFV